MREEALAESASREEALRWLEGQPERVRRALERRARLELTGGRPDLPVPRPALMAVLGRLATERMARARKRRRQAAG